MQAILETAGNEGNCSSATRMRLRTALEPHSRQSVNKGGTRRRIHSLVASEPRFQCSYPGTAEGCGGPSCSYMCMHALSNTAEGCSQQLLSKALLGSQAHALKDQVPTCPPCPRIDTPKHWHVQASACASNSMRKRQNTQATAPPLSDPLTGAPPEAYLWVPGVCVNNKVAIRCHGVDADAGFHKPAVGA